LCVRDHTAVDEVDDPVGEQLRVDAQVAMPGQGREQRVRDPADADLQRRAVGDVLDHRGGDAHVALVGSGRRHFDKGPRRLIPADHL
jgi:hypothetical protein